MADYDWAAAAERLEAEQAAAEAPAAVEEREPSKAAAFADLMGIESLKYAPAFDPRFLFAPKQAGKAWAAVRGAEEEVAKPLDKETAELARNIGRLLRSATVGAFTGPYGPLFAGAAEAGVGLMEAGEQNLGTMETLKHVGNRATLGAIAGGAARGAAIGGLPQVLARYAGKGGRRALAAAGAAAAGWGLSMLDPEGKYGLGLSGRALWEGANRFFAGQLETVNRRLVGDEEYERITNPKTTLGEVVTQAATGVGLILGPFRAMSHLVAPYTGQELGQGMKALLGVKAATVKGTKFLSGYVSAMNRVLAWNNVQILNAVSEGRDPTPEALSNLLRSLLFVLIDVPQKGLITRLKSWEDANPAISTALAIAMRLGLNMGVDFAPVIGWRRDQLLRGPEGWVPAMIWNIYYAWVPLHMGLEETAPGHNTRMLLDAEYRAAYEASKLVFADNISGGDKNVTQSMMSVLNKGAKAAGYEPGEAPPKAVEELAEVRASKHVTAQNFIDRAAAIAAAPSAGLDATAAPPTKGLAALLAEEQQQASPGLAPAATAQRADVLKYLNALVAAKGAEDAKVLAETPVAAQAARGVVVTGDSRLSAVAAIRNREADLGKLGALGERLLNVATTEPNDLAATARSLALIFQDQKTGGTKRFQSDVLGKGEVPEALPKIMRLHAMKGKPALLEVTAKYLEDYANARLTPDTPAETRAQFERLAGDVMKAGPRNEAALASAYRIAAVARASTGATNASDAEKRLADSLDRARSVLWQKPTPPPRGAVGEKLSAAWGPVHDDPFAKVTEGLLVGGGVAPGPSYVGDPETRYGAHLQVWADGYKTWLRTTGIDLTGKPLEHSLDNLRWFVLDALGEYRRWHGIAASSQETDAEAKKLVSGAVSEDIRLLITPAKDLDAKRDLRRKLALFGHKVRAETKETMRSRLLKLEKPLARAEMSPHLISLVQRIDNEGRLGIALHNLAQPYRATEYRSVEGLGAVSSNVADVYDVVRTGWQAGGGGDLSSEGAVKEWLPRLHKLWRKFEFETRQPDGTVVVTTPNKGLRMKDLLFDLAHAAWGRQADAHVKPAEVIAAAAETPADWMLTNLTQAGLSKTRPTRPQETARIVRVNGQTRAVGLSDPTIAQDFEDKVASLGMAQPGTIWARDAETGRWAQTAIRPRSKELWDVSAETQLGTDSPVRLIIKTLTYMNAPTDFTHESIRTQIRDRRARRAESAACVVGPLLAKGELDIAVGRPDTDEAKALALSQRIFDHPWRSEGRERKKALASFLMGRPATDQYRTWPEEARVIVDAIHKLHAFGAGFGPEGDRAAAARLIAARAKKAPPQDPAIAEWWLASRKRTHQVFDAWQKKLKKKGKLAATQKFRTLAEGGGLDVLDLAQIMEMRTDLPWTDTVFHVWAKHGKMLAAEDQIRESLDSSMRDATTTGRGRIVRAVRGNYEVMRDFIHWEFVGRFQRGIHGEADKQKIFPAVVDEQTIRDWREKADKGEYGELARKHPEDWTNAMRAQCDWYQRLKHDFQKDILAERIADYASASKAMKERLKAPDVPDDEWDQVSDIYIREVLGNADLRAFNAWLDDHQGMGTRLKYIPVIAHEQLSSQMFDQMLRGRRLSPIDQELSKSFAYQSTLSDEDRMQGVLDELARAERKRDHPMQPIWAGTRRILRRRYIAQPLMDLMDLVDAATLDEGTKDLVHKRFPGISTPAVPQEVRKGWFNWAMAMARGHGSEYGWVGNVYRNIVRYSWGPTLLRPWFHLRNLEQNIVTLPGNYGTKASLQAFAQNMVAATKDAAGKVQLPMHRHPELLDLFAEDVDQRMGMKRQHFMMDTYQAETEVMRRFNQVYFFGPWAYGSIDWLNRYFAQNHGLTVVENEIDKFAAKPERTRRDIMSLLHQTGLTGKHWGHSERFMSLVDRWMQDRSVEGQRAKLLAMHEAARLGTRDSHWFYTLKGRPLAFQTATSLMVRPLMTWPLNIARKYTESMWKIGMAAAGKADWREGVAGLRWMTYFTLGSMLANRLLYRLTGRKQLQDLAKSFFAWGGYGIGAMRSWELGGFPLQVFIKAPFVATWELDIAAPTVDYIGHLAMAAWGLEPENPREEEKLAAAFRKLDAQTRVFLEPMFAWAFDAFEALTGTGRQGLLRVFKRILGKDYEPNARVWQSRSTWEDIQRVGLAGDSAKPMSELVARLAKLAYLYDTSQMPFIKRLIAEMWKFKEDINVEALERDVRHYYKTEKQQNQFRIVPGDPWASAQSFMSRQSRAELRALMQGRGGQRRR